MMSGCVVHVPLNVQPTTCCRVLEQCNINRRYCFKDLKEFFRFFLGVYPNIGCISLQVIAVCNTTYEFVEGCTSVARGNDNRFAIYVAQWLQHHINTILQISCLLCIWYVCYSVFVRSCRADEFFKGEVFTRLERYFLFRHSSKFYS